MDNKENQKYNLISCIIILVSGMIGSAIFSLSGLTIEMAGASSIVSWIIAGIVMLFYGLFMCELATIFPKSGGAFYFSYRALGRTEEEGKLFGFISAWGYIVSCITAVAFSSIYVGIYLGVSFPIFSNMQVPLAILTILFSLFYNSLDLKSESRISGMLTFFLFLTLITFIVIALFSKDTNIINNFWEEGTKGKVGFLISIPTAMVGYGSIVAMSFMASHVHNRKVVLPLAAVISMFIVIFIYSMTIFAIVSNIGAKEIKESGMQFIPLFAVCFTKLNNIPFLSKVVSFSAVIALISTVVVVMALVSRSIQVLSQMNIFPNILAKENKKGMPVNASLVVSIVAILLSLRPDFTSFIVSLGTLLNAISIIFHIVSLYVVRKKLALNDVRVKDVDRSKIYKIGGGSILIFLVLAILLICYIPDILSGGYLIWIYTIGIYLVGIIYYKLRK